jgi:alkylated DNA repair protein (DNA oxidative demethylase)
VAKTTTDGGDLFTQAGEASEPCPGVWLLRGLLLEEAPALWAEVQEISAAAPPRRMMTPMGFPTQVSLTNCGMLGWTSDRQGYRYAAQDPDSGNPWPPLPARWSRLASLAAMQAGFPGFTPDACLINHYAPGTKMGLHQDRNERDFSAPIVSFSLGLPVNFVFGGASRRDPVTRIPLQHGDAMVWGGHTRLHYHGVLTLRRGHHSLTGERRINLTFRKAG